MAWRTLLVESEGKLKTRDRQLILGGDGGAFSVAMEELAVVVFDGPAASVSTSVLAGLCKEGSVALFCDEKHMPAGLMLPFHQHTRQTKVASEQNLWSEPFKKRVWQTVVRRKIENQGACLEALEVEGFEVLTKMAGEVASGDPGNIEARAAQYYWKRLFGPEFRRAGWRHPDPNRQNAALNYGYAVLRAAVARSLVAYGLLPCFGVHHDSNLNAFNLADDFLEPLRPMVDFAVKNLSRDWPEEEPALSKVDRTALASLGGKQVKIDGGCYTIIRATDLMAQALVRAGAGKTASLLLLPEFLAD